jgi:4-hydroxy-tetrahydrodipicolinate synthase
MYQGAFTALITPFKDNKVDYDSFAKLLNHQVENEIHGLVVLGSTGESMNLSRSEKDQLIKMTLDTARSATHKPKVIVGAGSNSTHETVENTLIAEKMGADAVMLVSPYYNKPTQDGIYQHFKFINDNSNIPIILYTVPGRTASNIEEQTVLELFELKNIIGIKDATGDLLRPVRIHARNSQAIQLSGEDATMVMFNLAGGKGVISVASNIIPKVVVNIQNLSLSGNFQAAQALAAKYQELFDLIFIETNPIPVKYFAYKLGLIATPDMRLPLTSLSEKSRDLIDAYIEKNKALL